MDVTLPPDLDRFVRAKVASGEYDSPGHVLCEALRWFEARDRLRWLALEELRREVAIGIEQCDRGQVAPLDARATLARIRDRKAAGVRGPS